LSVRDYMSLFPDFDAIREQMTVGKLAINMPDLVKDFTKDTKIDLVLNTEFPFKTHGPQGNFIKIRSDGFTVMQNINFDLMVEDLNKPNTYVTLRKGKVTFYI
jgi:hypothetical protein